MLILSKSEITRLLPIPKCIDIMDDAMRQTSQRRVTLPLRQFMPVPQTTGRLGLMPGYIAEPARFGLKIVSKYQRPSGSKHGTHVGAVVLFDAAEGLMLAMMEGGTLTAIRTAAASGLATRTLARADSKVLGMLGCGEEAHVHIPAMLAVRPFTEILIWGRSTEKVKNFIGHLDLPAGVTARAISSAQNVVEASDVICTVTSAATPILMGDWIKPGTHLNLVGSAVATTAEVDTTCVSRSRFYVDYREAALTQAGELLNAIKEGVVTSDHIVGEIGDVLLGKVPGRGSADDITVYKSLGISSQDLAAADYVYTAARAQNVGAEVDLGA